MSDLTWQFDIQGNAADAMARMRTQLAAFAGPLEDVEKQLAKLEFAKKAQEIEKISDPLKRAIATTKLYVDEEKKMAGSSKDAAKSTDELGDALGSLGVFDIAKFATISGAIGLVADAAKRVGAALVGGTADLFKFGLEASQGKRAMLAMLGTFEGANTDEVFSSLQELGIATGRGADETVKAYADLRAAGFDLAAANDLLAASADLAALRGGGADGDAAAKKFQDLFVKFNAIGKVGTKDLTTLSRDVGVSVDELQNALAARLNVPAEAAHQLLIDGKADAKEVQAALLDVVKSRSGGDLGDFAKNFQSGSVEGQIKSLKDVIGNLFEDIDFSPVAGMIANVREALSGSIGEQLKASIEKLFGLMGGIENLDFAGTMQRVADVITSIVDGLAELKAGVVEGFNSSQSEAFLSILTGINGSLVAADGNAAGIRKLGQEFGYIVGVVAQFLQMLERFVGYLPSVSQLVSIVPGLGAIGQVGQLSSANDAVTKQNAGVSPLDFVRNLFTDSAPTPAVTAQAIQSGAIATATASTNNSRGPVTVTFGGTTIQGGGDEATVKRGMQRGVTDALAQLGI